VLTALGLNFLTIQATEFRHHKAHEHGVAHMNVAFEGYDLYIEFISPAANIVGFEHHPRTEEQKSTVKKAVQMLKAGEMLFDFSPGAEGRLVTSSVNTDIEDYSEEVHPHEQDESRKVAEHEKHRRHEEPHEADEYKRHSEFKSEYHIICKHPDKLAHIDVMMFGIFPGIERIEVQLLTDTKQTAFKLTAKDNKISF
jgi:hypothetical protein